MIYRVLDLFFVGFHTTLIIFNLIGWIWKRSRLLNLIVLLITGASWLIVGLFVGTLGYCPLTDLHFKILYRLGINDLPGSYIKYLIDRITGLNINSIIVDRVTLYGFLIVLVISVILNIKQYRSARKI